MIWPALYSIRDDTGLEATGLRAVFDGMIDLGGPESTPEIEFASADGLFFASADGAIFAAKGDA
jgi:hypothetical protein